MMTVDKYQITRRNDGKYYVEYVEDITGRRIRHTIDLIQMIKDEIDENFYHPRKCAEYFIGLHKNKDYYLYELIDISHCLDISIVDDSLNFQPNIKDKLMERLKVFVKEYNEKYKANVSVAEVLLYLHNFQEIL